MEGVIVGAMLFGWGAAVGALFTAWLLRQHAQERAQLHNIIGQLQLRVEQLEQSGIPEMEL